MKGVISIMKKDYLLIRYNKFAMVSIILWLPVLMLIPIVYSDLIILMGSIIIFMTTFGIEGMKGNLINSLPVKKSDVIISRYIMFFINSLGMVIYLWINYFIFKKLNIGNIDVINWNSIFVILIFSIYVFLFSVNVETGIPLLYIIIIPMNFFNLLNIIMRSNSIELSFKGNRAAIIGAIAVFTVSILISLYKCRGRKGLR